MADDYLSDREQEEALRSWWSENWRWIFSGVALGLALLGGWRYWEAQRAQRAVQASQLYVELQAALSKPDIEQAQRLLADLTDGHDSSAYTQQGRLLLAKAHVDAARFEQAIALLRAVVDDADDRELADVARLRTARLLIQQGQHDEALELLDPQAAGAFAAQVREVRGDALLAKGDSEGARAEYAAALAANADAQIDRTMLEMKLQEVGGDAPAASTSAVSTRGQL